MSDPGGILASPLRVIERTIETRDIKAILEIIDEYQAVWLLRNRPGGLSDSVARLERSRRDYLA